jgi:uncharacterized membrane protein YeaQ/YmgE (transglycosylase-associated protein family)
MDIDVETGWEGSVRIALASRAALPLDSAAGTLPYNNNRDRLVVPHLRRKTLIHYIWMFIVGIVVGLIALRIMPGGQHMGLLMTGVLGIVGSFVGGLIGRLFSKPPEGAPFHPAGIIMSIVGALIVLFVMGKVM